MSTSKAWTDADRELLRRLYARGEVVDSIAARLGRKLGSIRGQIAARGLRREVGQRQWTDEDVERLRELYMAGLSVPVIAQCLKRTTATVEHYLWVHKIRQSKKPKPKTEPKVKEVRKITEHDRRLLHDFLNTFLRTHVLAEKRGIKVSKSELFGPFLQVYTTQGAFNGRTCGSYLSGREQAVCSN